MASELSNYLANAFLNWFRGNAAPAAPGTVYVALFNGDPTATGSGGTEVTTTIRPAGRVGVPFSTVSARQITNSSEIDFGASAGVATVTHAALFDAASTGNMLCYSPLDTTRAISTGDAVVIPIGDLAVHFN